VHHKLLRQSLALRFEFGTLLISGGLLYPLVGFQALGHLSLENPHMAFFSSLVGLVNMPGGYSTDGVIMPRMAWRMLVLAALVFANQRRGGSS
jgi:hypothetical protein